MYFIGDVMFIDIISNMGNRRTEDVLPLTTWGSHTLESLLMKNAFMEIIV